MLVEFVRSLPPPVLRYDEGSISQPWGYAVFETVGCEPATRRGLAG